MHPASHTKRRPLAVAAPIRGTNCRASRASLRQAVMLCASFALGCGTTTSFSARVADPRAVAVDDAETGAPILAPGAGVARESIPRTTGGWVARESTGEITFGSEHPDTHIVVSADGAVVVAVAPDAQWETRDFRAKYYYTWRASPWPAPEVGS